MSLKNIITVGLSYQLINIIIGHMQCHVRLVWIPRVFWVIFLVQCFYLFGLEANGCLVRICVVENITSCLHFLSWFIFLCSVSILSQAIATMTAPPVTVVCTSALSLTMNVTMAHAVMGLPVTLDQHDVVLPSTTACKRHGMCCWPCYCVAAAALVPDASSGICPLCYGSSTGKVLSFRVELHLPVCLCMLVSSSVVYAFCFQVPWWVPYLPMGAQLIVVCTTAALSEHTHGRHVCILVMVIGPY